MNQSKSIYRVSLISLGVKFTTGSTCDGYEFAPLEPSRAYEALVVRLAPILRDVFGWAYPFTEDLRPHFDPSDPVGIVRSPWRESATAEAAKSSEEVILERLLRYAEFVRSGKGRVFAYVIETLLPGTSMPTVQIAPQRLTYNGNLLRGMDNEIGQFVDRYAESLEARPELATLFEAFVDAREEMRLDIAIARYWAVLEALAKRWLQTGGKRPDGLAQIVWKGAKMAPGKGLDAVWAYCHLPHYIPVHLDGATEHLLSDQLRASYMLRNITMHGTEVMANGNAEVALAEEYKARDFPHQWFGMRSICESALRWELSRSEAARSPDERH